MSKLFAPLFIIAIIIFTASLSLHLLLNDLFLGWNNSHSAISTSPWTQEERFQLASQSLDFLQSLSPVSVAQQQLSQITKPGTSQPLYTSAEIAHLVDVKTHTDRLRLAGILSFALLAVAGICVYHYSLVPLFLNSLITSSKVILTITIVLSFTLLLFWQTFFIRFHELLFPAGNWTFAANSSLILLFPETFWFHFGITWVALIVVISLIIWLLAKNLLKFQLILEDAE